MEVIKYGWNSVPGWQSLVSCSECKSELLVRADDLTKRNGEDYDWFTVVCPVCSNLVEVKSVPDNVQRYVEKKRD